MQAFHADELTALSEIAADLGLNRGELLTGESMLLFVEGVSDQYVLEGLFSERLRRAGIAVVPLHGVRQLRQILDATVLLRYSSAKVGVMVDKLDEHQITRLVVDTKYRNSAMQSRKIEERELAVLLDDAIGHGRVLEPLGLPVDDIFFLLDSDAIRDTFRALRLTDDSEASDVASKSFPDYPGHDAFLAELPKNEHWKTFAETRYGIPKLDVSWYVRIADRMRQTGVFPEDLVTVIERLELLSTMEIPASSR